MNGDKVEIYKEANGEWSWRRKAPNGKIVSIAGESFRHRGWAITSAERNNPDINKMWIRVLDVTAQSETPS